MPAKIVEIIHHKTNVVACKSEHPLDNLSDLVRINGAATISVKSCEDPVEFLLNSRHVLHIRCLEPLEEVQCSTVVLIKHSEQSIVENIVLDQK